MNITDVLGPNPRKKWDVSTVPAISYVKDFQQAILEQPFVSGWDCGSRFKSVVFFGFMHVRAAMHVFSGVEHQSVSRLDN